MMKVENSSEASAQEKSSKGKTVRKHAATPNTRKKAKVAEECLIEVTDSD